MRSQWNDDEDAALQGLTPEAQIIYLRGFRRYMNYGTGVAGGRVRKLSTKALAELISVDPDWGSSRARSDSPSRGRVRARIAELERAGLVADCGSCRALGLIFRLPLADTGSVRPEKEQPKEQPREAPKEQPKCNVVKLPENKVITDSEGQRNNQESDQRNNQRNNPHLYYSTLLNSTNAGTQGDAAVPETYQPQSPSEWGSFLGREREWAYHRVSKPKLIILYQYWTQMALTIGDMRLIMASAEANLGRIPDGPEYYRPFAESYATERDRLAEQNKIQKQRGTHVTGASDPQHRSRREEQAAVNRQLTDLEYAFNNF